jgi:ribosomal protein L20A (L18A)
MEYIVKGRIKRAGNPKFELKINAKSQKHALESAIVKIGAKQGVKKNAIEIKEITESK